jgi:etoposide-induced 2.4 mRNA
MTSVITLVAKNLLISRYLGALVEVFMFSILNAYYCYEYKTAMLEMDLLSSLGYFEAQWAYFAGFGSFYTLLLFLFKEVGSSLFFLILPIMVIISLDEHGSGVLAYKDDRACQSFSFPIFTMAYYPHKWILKRVN